MLTALCVVAQAVKLHRRLCTQSSNEQKAPLPLSDAPTPEDQDGKALEEAAGAAHNRADKVLHEASAA